MDRDIRVVVKDRVATAEGNPVIICGNSDYTITITFDDEWAGVEVKTALFKWLAADGVKKHEQPFTGDKVEVPILADTREVEVGVYAGNLTTTTGAAIRCKPCIRCGSGEKVEPSPDKYDQLMELIKNGGLDGQSAYEAAKAGGYEGTEEEFQKALADIASGSAGSGLTDEQAADLAANTKARHTHGNGKTFVPASEVSYTHYNIQDTSGTAKGALDEAIDYVTGVLAPASHSHKNAQVLNSLADDNGVLTYNGEPLGDSGAAERPKAEYVYDFVNDYRMIYESGTVVTFCIMNEEATDEEKSMVGKEIADVEFERSTGEWVSMKNAVLVDFLPCISLLNRISETTELTGVESILFAAIYCPSMNWLLTDIQSNALSKIRITYYTD